MQRAARVFESVTSLDRGESCSSCWNWLPHVHFPFVGYCTLWGITTFEDYYCSSYKLTSVDRERFYWCATCKIRLNREEAVSHWIMKHRVFRGAYVEPDIREEIYEG
ncbi:MAG: hypothetical protein P3X22_004170 [Thermoprotei archaeon]|nr:hypothetical protein [Thermoprotei archaeon]